MLSSVPSSPHSHYYASHVAPIQLWPTSHCCLPTSYQSCKAVRVWNLVKVRTCRYVIDWKFCLLYDPVHLWSQSSFNIPPLGLDTSVVYLAKEVLSVRGTCALLHKYKVIGRSHVFFWREGQFSIYSGAISVWQVIKLREQCCSCKITFALIHKLLGPLMVQ